MELTSELLTLEILEENGDLSPEELVYRTNV
jgi:hypothetical protein